MLVPISSKLKVMVLKKRCQGKSPVNSNRYTASIISKPPNKSDRTFFSKYIYLLFWTLILPFSDWISGFWVNAIQNTCVNKGAMVTQ